MGEKLTGCEKICMLAIWDADQELCLPEILSRVNTTYGQTWKPQTVSTFLARLVRKNFLIMYREGRKFLYQPVLTKFECFRNEVMDMCQVWCDSKKDVFLAEIEKVLYSDSDQGSTLN